MRSKRAGRGIRTERAHLDSWNDRRLKRLFKHYNKKFWKGKLPDVVVRKADTSDNIDGRYFPEDDHIEIYVSKMKKDREIRSTLLHEMCHLAAGRKLAGKGYLGHGNAFYNQLEKLLRQKAPIDMESGENPSLSESGITSLEFNVPERFKLCRAELEKFSKKYAKSAVNAPIDGDLDMGEYMVDEFEKFGRDCDGNWEEALKIVGRKIGMLNIDDRPLSWSQKNLGEAKAAFENGRTIRLMFKNRHSR